MDASIVVAGISALASIATVGYTARSARKATVTTSRLAAEDAAYQRSAAFDEKTQLKMQAQIDRQERQIAILQRQVNTLIRQVRAAGLVPAINEEET
jgi:hypothetical protein